MQIAECCTFTTLTLTVHSTMQKLQTCLQVICGIWSTAYHTDCGMASALQHALDCSMAYGLWHALLAIAWPLDWSMIYGLYSVACEPPKNLDTTHHRLTQRTTGELSHTWFCASALQHGLWAVAWPVACSMACGL